MKNSDAIEALEARIVEYESLMKQMVAESKKIGTIVAGPVKTDGQDFYRVRVNNDELVLVSSIKDIIEKDSEVIVTDTFISKVIPKGLVTVKEIPPFKHISWDEVGGLKSQIQDIRRNIESPIENAKLYREYGIQPSKGALLYGPPGCGKTLISKVIASGIIGPKGNSESFVYIKGPELLSQFVGNTEERIRNIFLDCRKHTIETGNRCVVFIDEAESLLSKRGTGISSDVNSTIVPQFLAEMDGFDENAPFVLLSTNLPNSLDPAVIREGRIDLKIEIKRPTEDDAIEIFGIHLKNIKMHEKKETLSLSAASYLYGKGVPVSGSMIKTIANTAAQESLHNFLDKKTKVKGVTESDMHAAIDKIINSQVK